MGWPVEAKKRERERKQRGERERGRKGKEREGKKQSKELDWWFTAPLSLSHSNSFRFSLFLSLSANSSIASCNKARDNNALNLIHLSLSTKPKSQHLISPFLPALRCTFQVLPFLLLAFIIFHFFVRYNPTLGL